MEEKHKVIGIMGLIALRKSEAYYKAVNELSKDKKISKRCKEKIKKHISEMDNERFLSKEEKRDKKIDVNLTLRDINIKTRDMLKEIE